MSEKEVLSDFSELFQENYDRIPKELDQLTKAFKTLNVWLKKSMPKDLVDKDRPKLVYQYLDETQEEFLEFQSQVSAITESVFLVVKDINEISAVGTSTFEKTANVVSEGEPSGVRQIVNLQQPQRGSTGFLDRFRKKPTTNLPKSIEDFHIRSENWKEEIMNIPNLWGKYVNFHHMGVLRQKVFDGDGLMDYRDLEVVYLNTRIEPNITKVVKRALEIKGDKEIDKIKEVYTQTLQTEAQIEQAKLMTGQGGGSEEKT